MRCSPARSFALTKSSPLSRHSRALKSTFSRSQSLRSQKRSLSWQGIRWREPCSRCQRSSSVTSRCKIGIVRSSSDATHSSQISTQGTRNENFRHEHGCWKSFEIERNCNQRCLCFWLTRAITTRDRMEIKHCTGKTPAEFHSWCP